MGNVWKAMRKHQAEEAAKTEGSVGAAQVADPDSPPGQASSRAEGEPAARKDEPGGQTATSVLIGAYAEELLAYHDPGHPITEDYRKARISLLAKLRQDRMCSLITSAAPGEGKTVTCANLGFVLAEREDRTTILVDGDLRKASLGKLFNAKGGPGLTGIIKGKASIDEATIALDCAHENLFLLPASTTEPHEVGKLLARPGLEETIDELRKRYDYVLIDTPPTTMPDAETIGRCAQDAILIIRMGKTRREAVLDAKRRLGGAQVNVLGIILTHRKIHKSSYRYYRYHYNYRYGES